LRSSEGLLLFSHKKAANIPHKIGILRNTSNILCIVSHIIHSEDIASKAILSVFSHHSKVLAMFSILLLEESI
jgi:hypothetical protein